MADTVKAKDSGTHRAYNVSFDQAWSASLAVLHEAGSSAIEEHRDQHYMSTEIGVGATSWGTYVTAWVDPAAGGGVTVTVVTKKRAKLTISTQLDESGFLARLDAQLHRSAAR
jgi:hypothetical protein